ncbi:C6 transcription factor [Rhodotorula toruloides]|uniref:C6 transcription factor n=1 Tax=Rhodotorula toruloides TaxID=5286 RepID=A0A511KGY9_RHOTO|nr:C6 transcription factor [Rhodotorula toruloides]
MQPLASTSAAGSEQFDTPSPIDVVAGPTSKGKKKERDEEDGDPEKPPVKKRNRKPVTCAQCRRRHLTRDAEAQELRLQLDRLEGLLGALSRHPIAAAVGLAASPTTPAGGPSTGMAEENAAEALGLLATNSSTAAAGPSSMSSVAHRAQVLANNPTVSHLVALLPPKKELETLVNRFLNSEHLYFPIVHVPKFQARLAAFNSSNATEAPLFLGLVFAMLAHELDWQATEPGATKKAALEKENAGKRFCEASLEALRMGSYLEQPTFDAVRALIVLHRHGEQNMDRRSTHFLSQAVQLGQMIGLNRDAAGVPGISIIELEERRRVWHMLLAADWLDCSGRPSAIATSQFDVKPFVDAYDADITSDGITPRPFPAFTPTLLLGIQGHLAAIAHNVSETAFVVKGAVPLTCKFVDDQNAALAGVKASLPGLQFDGDAVIPLDQANFASDRFRIQAHSAAMQLTIRLNRPFLARGFVDPRFAKYRHSCLLAAQELVGLYLGYDDGHPLARFAFLAYHCMNAMLVLAVDLYQDPQGLYAERNRRLIGQVSLRVQGKDKTPAMTEVLRIVFVLMGVIQSQPQHPSIPVLATSAPLAASTVLTRPLPAPLTNDPFASNRLDALISSSTVPDLAKTWSTLATSYKILYGAPDFEEWSELVKIGAGAKEMWSAGVGLVAA